jgi:hypothetical protein
MTITNKVAGETRKVEHFWYTGWPDHGVPASAQPVLMFLRAVRDATTGSASPILVHCSAGIGRTLHAVRLRVRVRVRVLEGEGGGRGRVEVFPSTLSLQTAADRRHKRV